MNRIQEYKNRIAELQKKICEIQNECSHPRAATERIAKAQTGGYDYQDNYWTECYCTLCEKQWTEPQ